MSTVVVMCNYISKTALSQSSTTLSASSSNLVWMLGNTVVVPLAKKRRGILSTSDLSKTGIQEPFISIEIVAPVGMSYFS
jgi:hypothetical protein